MKIMNFRYFFILAIWLLLVNVLLTAIFASMKITIIFSIVLAVVLVVCVILSVKFKNKILIRAVSMLTLSLILCVNVAVRQNKVESLSNYDNKNVAVQGRICSDYTFNDFGNIVFTIDSITLIDENVSKKVSGKISVSLNGNNIGTQNIEIGRYVRFLANLSVNQYNVDDISYLSGGKFAYAIATGDDITILEQFHLTIREKFHIFIRSKLNSANLEFSGIAYAMLFGDSSYIENDVKEVFRQGGISHLLAVSGLHISILLSLLMFILDKFKVSKKGKLFGSCLILGIYSYFCNFSVSVIRAIGMAIVAMIADIKGEHYDGMSAMSFMFCAISLVNPTKMFSYSFILSFSAVFVILLFSNAFERLFGKLFYSRFASALAVCVSIELGLSLIQLTLFESFSILSLFSNLICVPIATFTFILTIILLIISIILPFMTFTLKIFDYLIVIVVKFSSWINSFGWIINIAGLSLGFVLLCLTVILFVSPYVNKRPFLSKFKKH